MLCIRVHYTADTCALGFHVLDFKVVSSVSLQVPIRNTPWHVTQSVHTSLETSGMVWPSMIEHRYVSCKPGTLEIVY